jgi:hypothetical protein
MDAIARKDAARKFKARKPPCGVYAVRSTTTGQVWVGSFANLEAMRNRLWFSLRQGLHRDRKLQEEWNAHGELQLANNGLHQRHPATERDTGSSRGLLAAEAVAEACPASEGANI